MGKNVHVIQKHQEYGSGEAFNWKYEEFHSFLNSLGCNVCGEHYVDDFECEEDKYEKALEFLKTYKEKGADCKKVKKFFKDVQL